MNIIIDLLIVIVAVAVIVLVSNRSVLRAVPCMLAVLFALMGAHATTPLCTSLLSKPIQSALIEKATMRVASLAQVPMLEDAESTLAQIDKIKLFTNHTEELESLAVNYHVEFRDMLWSPDTHEMVEKMTEPLAETISEAILLAAFQLIYFILFWALFRFILFQKAPKERLKRKFNVISCVVGCVTAVLLITYGVLPLIEAFRPYTVGILRSLKLDAACDRSTLYGLMEKCNLIRLLKAEK